MRQAVFLVLALCLVAGPAAAAKPVLITDTAFKGQIDKAALFEKEGKWQKAQTAYEKILKKYALTASQFKKTRQCLDSVNIKMFFSPEETPGSFLYTVQAGDRLFDLSKKFKTTVGLIKKSNRLKTDSLQEGQKLKIIKGAFSIEVDKSDNELTLFFNKKRVKQYRVTTGLNNKTPAGTHKIINKIKNPIWYYDNKVIPAGNKDNRLGTRWMGFDKAGYGIHGTVEPEDIGKQASLGCVRMLNRDVEELYVLVPLGTKVSIKD